MTLTHEEHADPRALRAAIRRGTWSGPTAGLAPGHAQANLVVLPAADALDFLRFCVHNPQPCPVLEVTDPGSPEPIHTAPGADLRTDLPRYRVYRNGEVIDSSSASGALGQLVKVSMKNGMFIDAVSDAPSVDGRSKTQVRVNVFHRDDTDMTFEFRTLANLKEGLSFDYALPAGDLKFRIEVVPVE